MKCLYHSADLDGHCAGAIVKRKHPEIELIGINYGDESPIFEANEQVIMVDFTLQPFEKMIELSRKVNLTWIDHHKTALEEAEIHGFDCMGIRDLSRSGCELTWKYFFPEFEMPKAVRLLGRYDVWDHSNPHTMPFQWGMRMFDTDPSNDGVWVNVFEHDDFVHDVIENGELLLEYRDNDNRKYAGACAFETELDGLNCIAINRMLTNSQLFDSVFMAGQHDAMIAFGWRKGKWNVSMYTTKDSIDVSTVCKNHGGGGHKQAAGFQCLELPFKLN